MPGKMLPGGRVIDLGLSLMLHSHWLCVGHSRTHYIRFHERTFRWWCSVQACREGDSSSSVFFSSACPPPTDMKLDVNRQSGANSANLAPGLFL